MANIKFMPSAPNQILWIVALIAGFLSILGTFYPCKSVVKV